MDDSITIGLDIAEQVFQARGAESSDRIVVRKRLTRARLLTFFSAQPLCTVAMEACVGAFPELPEGQRPTNWLAHRVPRGPSAPVIGYPE